MRNKGYKIDDKLMNSTLCSAGINSLSINSDFEVFCCPNLKISLGDLKRESLTKIWENRNRNSELSKIRQTKKKDLKECWKHDYCQYCVYCPGIAYLGNKYLEKYEPFCIDAKIRMKASTHKINKIVK